MFFFTLLLIGIVNGEETNTDCQPILADSCFNNFNLSELLCYEAKNCNFNADTVCSEFQDRTDCAQGIIDGDCPLKLRDNFDRWMNAILAVQNFICNYKENKQALTELFTEETDGKRCWNNDVFLKCVEEKTRVTHIVDMLQVMIDINECNWILIAFTTCSAKAETCRGRRDFLPEIFHIFIEQIKCSPHCSKCTTNFNHKVIKVISISFIIQYLLYSK